MLSGFGINVAWGAHTYSAKAPLQVPNTSSPGLNCVTVPPTAITWPATSTPGRWLFMRQSSGLTEAARTRMTTSLFFGTGCSRSFISTAAFMWAEMVVTICPTRCDEYHRIGQCIMKKRPASEGRSCDGRRLRSAALCRGFAPQLRELGRSYQTISKDLTRVMNRLKALYRGWGIPCGGTQVYAPHYREAWLNKIPQAGVRRRAELLYQQLDGLQGLRRNLRPELLAESRKHKAAKLLRQIPCIGPIRAARLLALMQTPHRFRSKRQLWTYSGLGIETRDSAQYRFVSGQLQRAKKPQQIRGLNRNHNHEMKEIFKSAATRASCGKGPLHDFYAALLAKGETRDGGL